MIEAIKAAKGKITLAAHSIGCTRETIYQYAKRYATVQSAIDKSRNDFDEELLDIAEHKLRQSVLEGEQWAVTYVLNKKGRARGYMDSNRTEVTGADGAAMVFKLVYPDDK
jgi:hypothetical protein